MFILDYGGKIQKKERWLKRLKNERLYHYAYQKWVSSPEGEKISLIKLLIWIWNDLKYLLKWNINLLLQLRAYGIQVKRYSGLSFYEQWKRMAYLVFVIRADSNKFRYNHLFEQDRWEKGDLFSYSRHNRITRKIEGFFPEDDVNRIHNKLKFFELCENYGWNTSSIHAIYEKGLLTYPNQEEIYFPKRDLFVKNVDGGQGSGSKYIIYENGIYRDFEGRKYDSDGLKAYLKKESKRTESLLIQDAEKNHDEWKRFSNGALATCRIVTGRSLKERDKIIPFFATLRMPVGKASADNYSLGGFASAIDIKTGKLGKAISSKPYLGSFSWNVHPDTCEQITGSTLYCFKKILDFTIEIHHKFSTLAVGWDLSLTEEGPCVIEGNPYWGAEVMESPANKPLCMTSYPIWVEECIEILSIKTSK